MDNGGDGIDPYQPSPKGTGEIWLCANVAWILGEETRDSASSYPLLCLLKSKNNSDLRGPSTTRSILQIAVCILLQSSKGPGRSANVSSHKKTR